jgi:hypothetical protein
MTTPYRLLNVFASQFDGQAYRHRVSNQNDLICVELFEDLLTLGKSPKLIKQLQQHSVVANIANKAHRVDARRGDGTLGELVPGEAARTSPGYAVARGVIATVEIGVECKVFNKAMLKQFGRVRTDMREQVAEFRTGTGSNPITVAVVGVNHATHTTGYEGNRAWPTGWVEEEDPATGLVQRKYHKHPIEEAAETIRRVEAQIRPMYDELLILPYKATNERPFEFEWVDLPATLRDYGTVLTKVSRAYEQRF